jgi:hypothetical protein
MTYEATIGQNATGTWHRSTMVSKGAACNNRLGARTVYLRQLHVAGAKELGHLLELGMLCKRCFPTASVELVKAAIAEAELGAVDVEEPAAKTAPIAESAHGVLVQCDETRALLAATKGQLWAREATRTMNMSARYARAIRRTEHRTYTGLAVGIAWEGKTWPDGTPRKTIGQVVGEPEYNRFTGRTKVLVIGREPDLWDYFTTAELAIEARA